MLRLEVENCFQLGPGECIEGRIRGLLLGTALGDALGLPGERMSAAAIAQRFGRLDRFRLLGQTGYVSDDTEQAALVAQSLIRFPHDPELCARAFRRSLLGWFLRLPWGAGMATLRACSRIALGLSRSGVPSAGNGAAMRAAVVGVFFHDRPEERHRFGRALAEVTHLDPRAIEGALFVAEVAAILAAGPVGQLTPETVGPALQVVRDPAFRAAIEKARMLAEAGLAVNEAASELGTSGFVVHSVSFATYCLLREGGDPATALITAVSAGGDTDSIGAILGGWLGALHGEAGLPHSLLHRIHDGPFGPTHLRALGSCLAQLREGKRLPVPGYSPAAALARNLVLYPVIVAHGFRRLFPR